MVTFDIALCPWPLYWFTNKQNSTRYRESSECKMFKFSGDALGDSLVDLSTIITDLEALPDD